MTNFQARFIRHTNPKGIINVFRQLTDFDKFADVNDSLYVFYDTWILHELYYIVSKMDSTVNNQNIIFEF